MFKSLQAGWAAFRDSRRKTDSASHMTGEQLLDAAIGKMTLDAFARGAFGHLERQGALPFQGFRDSGLLGGADEFPLTRTVADYFEDDPIFATSIMLPAEYLAGIPLKLMRKRRSRGGRTQLIPADESIRPNLILNEKPNLWQTPYGFKVELIAWLELQGMAFARKIKASASSQTSGLWIVDPDLIRWRKHPRLGVAEWFDTTGGNFEPVPADEVLYWRMFNPKDNVRGLGFGRRLMRVLETNEVAADFNLRSLKNDGRPSDLFFSSTEEGTTRQQAKAAEESYDEKFGYGGERRGKAMFLHMWKPEVVQRSSQDMQFQELWQKNREMLAGGMNIPSSFIQDNTRSTYANIGGQRIFFIDFKAIPMSRYFLDVLNTHFIRPFSRDLVAVMDFSDEPVMVERRMAMLEKVRELSGTMGGPQMISTFEVRQKLRELFPSMSGLLVTPDDKTNVLLAPMNVLNVDEVVSPIGPQPQGAPREPRDLDEKEKAIVERFAGATITRIAESEVEKILEWLHGLDEEMLKLARSFHETIIAERGKAELKRIGSELAFDMASPFVREWMAKAPLKFREAVPRTIELAIRSAFVEAIEEGEPPQATATKIRGAFSGLRNRALSTARTLTNGAFNAGSQAAWEQSGVVIGKRWFPNTERHADVDSINGVIPLKEKFVVGNSLLAFPADSSGNAEDVINCGCSSFPVMSTEEKADEGETINRTRLARQQILLQERYARRLERVLKTRLAGWEELTLKGLESVSEKVAERDYSEIDELLADVSGRSNGVAT